MMLDSYATSECDDFKIARLAQLGLMPSPLRHLEKMSYLSPNKWNKNNSSVEIDSARRGKLSKSEQKKFRRWSRRLNRNASNGTGWTLRDEYSNDRSGVSLHQYEEYLTFQRLLQENDRSSYDSRSGSFPSKYAQSWATQSPEGDPSSAGCENDLAFKNFSRKRTYSSPTALVHREAAIGRRHGRASVSPSPLEERLSTNSLAFPLDAQTFFGNRVNKIKSNLSIRHSEEAFAAHQPFDEYNVKTFTPNRDSSQERESCIASAEMLEQGGHEGPCAKVSRRTTEVVDLSRTPVSAEKKWQPTENRSLTPDNQVKRCTPSSDIKPKALIKPGLRRTKKSRGERTRGNEVKDEFVNRKLVQKTLDCFFKSSPKVRDILPEDQRDKVQLALNKDLSDFTCTPKHVRRILDDDRKLSLPVAVVLTSRDTREMRKSLSNPKDSASVIPSRSLERLVQVSSSRSNNHTTHDKSPEDLTVNELDEAARLRQTPVGDSDVKWRTYEIRDLSPSCPLKKVFKLSARSEHTECPGQNKRRKGLQTKGKVRRRTKSERVSDEIRSPTRRRHRTSSQSGPSEDELGPSLGREGWVPSADEIRSSSSSTSSSKGYNSNHRAPFKVGTDHFDSERSLSPSKLGRSEPLTERCLKVNSAVVTSRRRAPEAPGATPPPAKRARRSPSRDSSSALSDITSSVNLLTQGDRRRPSRTEGSSTISGSSPSKTNRCEERCSAPSPRKNSVALVLDEELMQAQEDEAARVAEAAQAEQRNRKRHTRGKRVLVYCDVLGEYIDRHPVQNEVPAKKWSKWLNPSQIRCLTLAMLGNPDLCLNYSLDCVRNEMWEDTWSSLAIRLNTICYSKLTNLNTGLRMTVSEWKTLWLDMKAMIKERVANMKPEERRHSLGSLECLLYSEELYQELKKSKGQCLGAHCPRVWCSGACIGVFCPTVPAGTNHHEE